MDKETLRLAFPEAIKFMRDKIPLSSTSYKQFAGEIQQIAFTISQITQASLLADIQALVIKQLEAGITIEGFKRNFDALLDKSGYNLGNRGYRAELVIQQNVRNAYTAGRYKQLTEPSVLKSTGAWLWRHRDSRVPRPAHKALDGKLLDPTSDFWDKGGFPCCAWGCRCTVFKVSKVELGDRVPEAPPPVDTIADKGFRYSRKQPTAERKTELLKEAKARLPKDFGDLL